MAEVRYERFRPRAITFQGMRDPDGYRIKVYSIVYGDPPFRRDAFEDGLQLAFGSLPRPAHAASRPGLGFAIAHQGRGANYVILGWWDRENELPTKVFVQDANRWRPARGSESFCVWDLEVLWYEREAYVRTVLGDDPTAGPDRYVGQRLNAPRTNP